MLRAVPLAESVLLVLGLLLISPAESFFPWGPDSKYLMNGTNIQFFDECRNKVLKKTIIVMTMIIS